MVEDQINKDNGNKHYSGECIGQCQKSVKISRYHQGQNSKDGKCSGQTVNTVGRIGGVLIADPDTYVGEKHRRKIGESITTNYSEADDYTVGNVLPKAYGGFGTSVSWKGIDFSVDFQYQLGGKVYDSQYASMMNLFRHRGGALHVDILDAYSAENTASNIPRLVYSDSYTNASSDRFLTSASYLSLQNITLGYTLPKKFTTKIGIQKIRIYCVADNVWTWSKRQGLDPRQSITGTSSNAYYSSIRTISGGVTVSF